MDSYKAFRRKTLIAILIIFTGLIGFFFVGLHYELFGSEINFTEKPATFLLLASISFSVFGVFYALDSFRVALFRAAIAFAAFFILYFGGIIIRGEW